MNRVPLRLPIQILICCIVVLGWSCSRKSSRDVIDLLAVEAILDMPINSGSDTTKLDQQIGTQYRQATMDQDDVCLWTYSLRMADGFALAYDTVNHRSNEFFQQAEVLVQKMNVAELELVTEIGHGYYYYSGRKTPQAMAFFTCYHAVGRSRAFGRASSG